MIIERIRALVVKVKKMTPKERFFVPISGLIYLIYFVGLVFVVPIFTFLDYFTPYKMIRDGLWPHAIYTVWSLMVLSLYYRWLYRHSGDFYEKPNYVKPYEEEFHKAFSKIVYFILMNVVTLLPVLLAIQLILHIKIYGHISQIKLLVFCIPLAVISLCFHLMMVMGIKAKDLNSEMEVSRWR